MHIVTSQDMQEAEHVIQGIIEKLRVGYNPQKVILLGSYASGNARSDSDLDLLIIKDTADWFRIAERDLQRVDLLLNAGDPEAAGFFLQQAAAE